MIGEPVRIQSEKNPNVSIEVTQGHFSTGFFHTNYYLNVSSFKANNALAKDIACELAVPYMTSTLVDTIVCIENTKVIGAYLADELLKEGTGVMNSGEEIHLITPMYNSNKQLTFYDNELQWISNKNVLLLTTIISSGRTVNNVLECLEYYKAIVSGISTIFLCSKVFPDKKVNTIFTSEDITGYEVYTPSTCELCKAGIKLDALVSSEGYRKL